jgi:hypothetical protein
MSGPSAAQQQLQTEQADFYQQAIQQQETTYGEDQSILKMMTGIYEPILAKGPNQEGFSTGESTTSTAKPSPERLRTSARRRRRPTKLSRQRVVEMRASPAAQRTS